MTKFEQFQFTHEQPSNCNHTKQTFLWQTCEEVRYMHALQYGRTVSCSRSSKGPFQAVSAIEIVYPNPPWVHGCQQGSISAVPRSSLKVSHQECSRSGKEAPVTLRSQMAEHPRLLDFLLSTASWLHPLSVDAERLVTVGIHYAGRDLLGGRHNLRSPKQVSSWGLWHRSERVWHPWPAESQNTVITWH